MVPGWSDGHASLLLEGECGLWFDNIDGGVPCDSGEEDVATVNGELSFFLKCKKKLSISLNADGKLIIIQYLY